MVRFVESKWKLLAALTLLTGAAGAQPQQREGAVWQPPHFQLPAAVPRPDKPKPMITSLEVEGVPVHLELTELATMSKRLGAPEGSSGDAGNALGWICLHGEDKDGAWGFWLLSTEIDGPSIGGFQWQRFPTGTNFDRRCKRPGDSTQAIRLPGGIRLGMDEAKLDALLGKPTSKDLMIATYSHSHKLTLENLPATAENDLYFRFDRGVATVLLVFYTVST